MAGQTTGMQKAFVIDDENGIPMYRGVVQTKANHCACPKEDGLVPLGIVTNDERITDGFSAKGSQKGKHIAVQMTRIGEIKTAEAIEANDLVMLGAGGLAKVGAVGKNLLGVAMEDGDEGDVIPVLINIHYGSNE